MTIKELETRTGMERANIRFYEKEGLLSPKRLDNGYRDYSEEDADLLLRIKLLRSLHLPLDEIRAVKDGKITLATILDRQQQRLSSEEKEVALAGKVCREIREEGASFNRLDAEKYLRQIAEKEVKSQVSADSASARPTYFSEPSDKDRLPPAFTPFRRFFARSIDLGIYGLIFYLILLQFVPFRMLSDSVFFTLLSSYVGYGVMLLVEPVLLHFFGCTPGKWLWGLRVEGPDGKLSLREARARTIEMFSRGLGWGIPGYILWREFACMRDCMDRKAMPWDYVRYYTVDESKTGLRAAGFIAAHLAGIGILAFAMLLQLLPPNRGELTVAEYAENYNYYVSYYGLSGQNFQLDENGKYAPLPDPPGTYTIYISELAEPEYTYQLKDGKIQAITMEMFSNGDFISSSVNDMVLSVLAYSGAWCKISDLFHFSGWMEEIKQNALADYSMQIPGATVKWDVEIKGYTDVGNALISEDENAKASERSFSRVVSIESGR